MTGVYPIFKWILRVKIYHNNNKQDEQETDIETYIIIVNGV